MNIDRVLHLAGNAKKLRIRKKNKKRVIEWLMNTNEPEFAILKMLYCAKDSDFVLHEYECPEDVYIRQCEEEFKESK